LCLFSFRHRFGQIAHHIDASAKLKKPKSESQKVPSSDEKENPTCEKTFIKAKKAVFPLKMRHVLPFLLES
jgi:hypothetical protein